jgi:glutaredoxin
VTASWLVLALPVLALGPGACERAAGPVPVRAAGPGPAAGPAPAARPAPRVEAASGPEAPASGRRVYWQYVDGDGAVRFVRSLEEIPAAWRDRAGRIEMAASGPAGGGAPAARPRAAAATRAAPEVVVYTTTWCGWCRRTLAWLDERGVAYVNKDIESDDRHREELLRKTGRISIPVVEIGGELVRGYDPSRMRELLGS